MIVAPAAFSAVTVKLNGTPAVAVDGAETTNLATACSSNAPASQPEAVDGWALGG